MDKKEYMKKYRQTETYKQRKKEQDKKYWLKNRERLMASRKEYQKIYNLKNKEKKRIWGIEWRKKNPDKLLKSSKKYRENNRKILQKKSNEYRRKNPQIKEAHNLSMNIPIPKNQMCQICHNHPAKEKHHWRYDKPFLINFLDSSCHKIIHFQNKL
jgi:hypothetical protein